MHQVLLIVQPHLTAYRLPVFAALAQHYDSVTLASSAPEKSSGYGEPSIAGTPIHRHTFLKQRTFLGGRLLWQSGLLQLILRLRPSSVLIAANPRLLSFWAALFLCRFLGIECNAYGQGLFNKLQPGRVRKVLYQLIVLLAHRYIAYTTSCLESLRGAGIDRSKRKLRVAENSLVLSAVVRPEEKTGVETGVLFLGRLREHCGLELLIAACRQLREQAQPALTLHVVGAGTAEEQLKSFAAQAPWITWHGAIYDETAILKISRECLIGCYPGAAGLSVVHFMGLSLIPVVHDRADLHMGPEPSYVRDGENGRLFSAAEAQTSLTKVLDEIFHDPDQSAMRAAAYTTYQRLNTPSLAIRLSQAMH